MKKKMKNGGMNLTSLKRAVEADFYQNFFKDLVKLFQNASNGFIHKT